MKKNIFVIICVLLCGGLLHAEYLPEMTQCDYENERALSELTFAFKTFQYTSKKETKENWEHYRFRLARRLENKGPFECPDCVWNEHVIEMATKLDERLKIAIADANEKEIQNLKQEINELSVNETVKSETK